MTMAAGLRSIAKVLESPPAPTVRAPVPDPTLEGRASVMRSGYSIRTTILSRKPRVSSDSQSVHLFTSRVGDEQIGSDC